MRWANFFHLYQPPRWPRRVIAKVARESYRPLVRFLLSNRSIRLTLNVSGSLTEQLLRSSHHDVISGLRRLLTAGQIELTDSAMYHPILPLLPEKEILRQIRLNRAVNRRAFGRAYRPRGFYPPEMAYNRKVGKVLSVLGYRWVILDGSSHYSHVDFTTRYRVRGTKLYVLFRNRPVSDFLAFAARRTDTVKFFTIVERLNGQTELVVTAMDGENLGHHRHEAKRVWQSLVRLPHVHTNTLSELLKVLNNERSITPKPASWSSQPSELKQGVPFGLWNNPKNLLHRLQWQLFSMVERLVASRERVDRLPPSTREAFDREVSSDWYWWASREPWWDPTIVMSAAERLQLLAEQLHPAASMQNRIRSLTEKITSTARTWHDSGAAWKHAARFLKIEKGPRYLGGERVG